jgi:hypothetical protein
MPILDDDVSLVVERRNKSQEWYNENFYGEFEEVYRSSKCKTKPVTVMVDGVQKEDKSRTNVSMPDTAVIIRRNAARMTAQAPTIRYISATNHQAEDRLTAMRFMQYDRSGEAWVQRLHVQQEETFGFSVTKLFWDKITQKRRFRVYRDRIDDRRAYLQELGATPEEIEVQIQALGPTLTPDEMQQSILQMGDTMLRTMDTTKYEGPCVKFVFIGDFFPEPGFKSTRDMAWGVEQYKETDRWVRYWADQTYVDPQTGEELPVFDPEAVKKLLNGEYGEISLTRQGNNDLRNRLRGAIGQSDPEDRGSQSKLARGKLFDILECHEMREDGWMYIMWIANESLKLGEMPYPVDMYGRSMYTEFVGLPDLITGIGDSTPRLGRFLQSMHNVVVNQRTDLITQVLRPLVFRRHAADVPDEVQERALMRIMDVKDPSDFTFPRDTDVPMSAWESEGQVLRMFNMLDGALANTDGGSNANPMSGKTATTAVLAQRVLDAMTQYKLDGLNLYFKDLGEKQLWMQQQMMTDPAEIPQRYVNRVEGMSTRYGNAVAITLDPMEIQEDYQVEPEAGSVLAVDDEFRRMNAQTLYQLAASNPVVFNITEAAKLYVETIKGADPAKLINPPAPMPPPPPKSNINVAIKFEMLPADVQRLIITEMTGQEPSPALEGHQAMNDIIKMSEAADAATNLNSPAVSQQEHEAGMAQGQQQHEKEQSVHEQAYGAARDIAKARAGAAGKSGSSSGGNKSGSN